MALVRNLELFAPTAGVLAFAAVTTRKHSLSRRSEALLRVGGTVVVAVISLAAFQTQRTLIVLALAIPASLFTGFYLAGVYTDASTSALGLVVGIVVAAPILFVLPFTPAEAFTRSFLPMFLSVGAVVSMPLCILAYRIGAAHTVTGAEHTANWARSRS